MPTLKNTQAYLFVLTLVRNPILQDLPRGIEKPGFFTERRFRRGRCAKKPGFLGRIA